MTSWDSLMQHLEYHRLCYAPRVPYVQKQQSQVPQLFNLWLQKISNEIESSALFTKQKVPLQQRNHVISRVV